MAETRCWKIRLKPGALGRVREWADELRRRKEEVLETLRDEEVLVESVFLEHTAEADYLIYYMKASDLDRNHHVARESSRPIDVYHRRFKADTWASSADLELLVDFENLEGHRP
jgi:Family of unknown function (DUF6176)